MRTFFFCLLLFCSLTSCTPPTDVKGANSQAIGQGILHPAEGNKFLFGFPILGMTQFVGAKNACEGAAGSVIPPLSLNQCGVKLLGAPLLIMESIMNGGKDPYERHVYLNGIEGSWVSQANESDCWAATLETTRKFLGLHPVSQRELLEAAQKICPRLNEQQRQGAEAYEIAYTITSKLKQYDMTRTSPHFCNNADCIIESLLRRHPVIMLGAGHAMLLVGADYTTRGSKQAVILGRLYVLDPAGNNQVKTWPDINICKVDVFLAY